MSYYVDIIDQVLAQSLFVIEQSSRSSIVLDWKGSDTKDEMSIVGSSLNFNFAHNEKVDAKFIKLFTGNEVGFKVELKSTTTSNILWQGFVVPDTYNEPYTNGVTFVGFIASDGLGRLKGKYLSPEFYNQEKSIIEICSHILSLTGLELDLIFNPAIENSLQKDWNQIFIDTSLFSDKGKKKDAYKIFDSLLQDMLCVCYQADNCWNIEGINKRHIRAVSAKRYDSTGVYLGAVNSLKLHKKITALVTPNVTMVPPYNEITVTHARIPQSFPETISVEKNDGWVVMSGVVGEIYATDWNGNNGYYCKAVEPNYANSIKKDYMIFAWGGTPVTEPFDVTKFVNLKTKIFVFKYQKIKISAEFTIINYFRQMSGIGLEAYFNPLKYEINLNGNILFSNRQAIVPDNQNLIFDQGKAKVSFDLIVLEDGLIDVKLWRPGASIMSDNILGFEITELKISPVAFKEEMIVTDIASNEFTIDKDIELGFSDDNTAFSNSFRLAKLNEATVAYNVIEIPVIYRFTQNGNNYSVVKLDGANLIKDNIYTVYHGGVLLENVEVIYNYNSSEQMVIKTDFVTTASFFVNVFKTDDYLIDRTSWIQWTDSVYKIETERYAKVVASIIRRMFNVATEKLDLVAFNAVKFNDIILFKYITDRQFVVVNCSWNLDENKSTLTLVRAAYRDSGNVGHDPNNLPPIVNAGTDIILDSDQTQASLLATAYDVDGFIVSQNWTKLVGGFGDVIVTPGQLATDLQNLTEDLYQYQIEVFDNDGGYANDTISLIRRRNYEISMVLDYLDGNGFAPFLSFQYTFNIDPEIAVTDNIVIHGRLWLFSNRTLLDDYARGRIKKNGVVIFEAEMHLPEAIAIVPFDVGYIAGDTISFEIEQTGEFPVMHFGSSAIYIDSVEFINGFGNVVTMMPLKAQAIVWP